MAGAGDEALDADALSSASLSCLLLLLLPLPAMRLNHKSKNNRERRNNNEKNENYNGALALIHFNSVKGKKFKRNQVERGSGMRNWDDGMQKKKIEPRVFENRIGWQMPEQKV